MVIMTGKIKKLSKFKKFKKETKARSMMNPAFFLKKYRGDKKFMGLLVRNAYLTEKQILETLIKTI
jgi:hypothetical protein